jgi:hypothetical protein
MEMGWREGDGGVWGATTNRTQFVKGRGALDSPRNWLAHQHGAWALGRGMRGQAQWTSSTALRTAMLWMQSKHCAPGMGHVGKAQYTSRARNGTRVARHEGTTPYPLQKHGMTGGT